MNDNWCTPLEGKETTVDGKFLDKETGKGIEERLLSSRVGEA